MSTKDRGLHSGATTATDRRQSPRLEVVGRIQGHIRPHDIPVTLLNVSHGGFLMRGPVNYAVGDVHKFRFTSENESESTVLRARVVHVMRVTTNGVAAYVIGLEFVDHAVPACQDAIERLVSAAAG